MNNTEMKVARKLRGYRRINLLQIKVITQDFLLSICVNLCNQWPLLFCFFFEVICIGSGFDDITVFCNG
jgi:hypothetical protein